MLRYSGYLLLTYLRKWTFLIIITSYILVFSVVTSLEIKSANNQNLFVQSFLNQVSIFDSLIPFVSGCIFIGFLIIFLFKEGQTDGMDLILSSKPIKRWEILISKYLVLIAYITLFNVVTFAMSYLISLEDTFGVQESRIEYAGSLAVGGQIVMVIFSSIIIFSAMFINSVSLIVLCTSLAVVLPATTFAMTSVTNATGKNFQFLDTAEAIRFMDDDGQFYTDNNYVFRGGDLSHYDLNGDGKLSDSEIKKTDPETGLNDINDSTNLYSTLVYFDPYYQWNNFYSIFRDDGINGKKIIADWSLKSTTYKNIESTLAFDDNAGGIARYVIKTNPYSYSSTPTFDHSSAKFNLFMEKANEFLPKKWMDNRDYSSRMQTIYEFMDPTDNFNPTYIYMLLMKQNPIIPLPELIGVGDDGFPETNGSLMKVSSEKNGVTEYQNIISLEPHEWSIKGFYIPFWIVVSSMLFIGTGIVFYKKDFK